jgi:transposase
VLISRKEKKKLVIQFAHEGQSTREIAKQAHISLRDIGKIIRKEKGDDIEENDELQKEKENKKG